MRKAKENIPPIPAPPPRPRRRLPRRIIFLIAPLALLFLSPALLSSCARKPDEVRTIEATGYCWCGQCNGYSRGNPKLLRLDFWNRYVNHGTNKGKRYVPRSASGERLGAYHPGLFSLDSLKKPWMIPLRIVLFPWLLLPRDGTIAAETDYFPFGTRMYVPGYGWGSVEDRGGAIKGPARVDLYFPMHHIANRWGRVQVPIEIYWPESE